MNKYGLRFNAEFLTPLISLLRPEAAYAAIRHTGRLGKGLNGPSFRFPDSTSDDAVEALVDLLNLQRRDAEEVIRRFHLIETRVLLEHLWLARRKLDYLPEIISMEDISFLDSMLRDRGPMLLLTAHSAYYFLIPWALQTLGSKIAFMMSDPRAAGADDHMLTGIDSFLELSRRIPVIFTNEGNTVRKSVELLKQGYSLLMVIDLPGHRGKGERITLLGKEFWLPSGCRWIAEEAQVPAASVFSRVQGIADPYRLSFPALPTEAGAIDLQKWAAGLEEVIRSSPESWLGWFYAKGMM
ncbi:MAG: hypothetical protein C0402_06340 [Thermodesulfovibrio sp.]|nr:hypothetical protein [Thermodesulfovibrio sp.]